jgi:hypothetical protein
MYDVRTRLDQDLKAAVSRLRQLGGAASAEERSQPVMAGQGAADLHGGPRVGFGTPALAFSMLLLIRELAATV